MKGTKYTESEKARQILCKYGINPYTDSKNLVIAVNYCHSAAYAKEAFKKLDRADKEFG